LTLHEDLKIKEAIREWTDFHNPVNRLLDLPASAASVPALSRKSLVKQEVETASAREREETRLG